MDPARSTAQSALAAVEIFDLLRFSLLRGPRHRAGDLLDADVSDLGDERAARWARNRIAGEGVGTWTVDLQDLEEVVPSSMYGDRRDIRIERVGQEVVPTPEFLRRRVGGDGERVGIREEIGTAHGETLYFRTVYYVAGQHDPEEVLRRVASTIYRPSDADHWTLPAFRDAFATIYDEPFDHCEVSFSSILCDERIAGLLGTDRGAAMLLRERRAYGSSGRLMSLCYTHFRADRVMVSFGGDAQARVRNVADIERA